MRRSQEPLPTLPNRLTRAALFAGDDVPMMSEPLRLVSGLATAYNEARDDLTMKVWQQPLPKLYRELSDVELRLRIEAAKETLGPRLAVLGHHYQQDAVIDFADFTGDSFELSRRAAEQKGVEYVVFCGVHFMAES